MNAHKSSKSHRFTPLNIIPTSLKKSCINLFSQKDECNLVTEKVVQVNPIPSNSSNFVNRSIMGYNNITQKKLSINRSCKKLGIENSIEVSNNETNNYKDKERSFEKDVPKTLRSSNKIPVSETSSNSIATIKSLELSNDKNLNIPKHKYNFSDGSALSKIKYDLTGETDSVSTKSVSDKNDYFLLDEFTNLEEKLEAIKTNLKNSKKVTNLCYEWMNYFIHSEMKEKLENFFRDHKNKFTLMQDAKMLELLSINLIYMFCFHENYNQLAKKLYNISLLTHQTFLLTVEFILSKSLYGNILQNKSYISLKEKLKLRIRNEDPKLFLRRNNTNLFNSIKDSIDLFDKKELTGIFSFYLSNLQTLNFSEVTQSIKLQIINKKVVSFPNNLMEGIHHKQPSIPFITTKPKKPYTLILDLDETLIHLSLNKDTYIGLLTFRPGLFDFLDEVSKYYEIIIFTCGTSQYANPIIDSIEANKSYIDHRLFREHTTIKNNGFVKDLSLIGRDLNKTLILDNLPQNFRLQKENGILINSFYTEDIQDDSLFKLLPYLTMMAEKKPQDIRKEMAKLKNEMPCFNYSSQK